VRTLFVADPFEGLDPTHDSTVAMMESAQAAGHEVWGATMADLAVDESGVVVRAAALQLKPATLHAGSWTAVPDWLSVGEPEVVRLEEFATVSVRPAPPVDEAYLRATYLLDHVNPAHTAVVNSPAGLRHANEKLYALNFRDVMADCIVSARRADLLAAAQRWGTAVAKPTGGMAGRGILLLRDGDPNLLSIIDTVTERAAHQVMVQRYIPEVDAGDRRVIVVNGEAVGVVNRRADGLDFRANMATGGSVEADDIDDDVARITAAVGPRLVSDGLWFVGLDVIGGYLSEVNVTSPTGLREIHAHSGIDVAARYVEFLEEISPVT
jgi:glutathione synthase